MITGSVSADVSQSSVSCSAPLPTYPARRSLFARARTTRKRAAWPADTNNTSTASPSPGQIAITCPNATDFYAHSIGVCLVRHMWIDQSHQLLYAFSQRGQIGECSFSPDSFKWQASRGVESVFSNNPIRDQSMPPSHLSRQHLPLPRSSPA